MRAHRNLIARKSYCGRRLVFVPVAHHLVALTVNLSSPPRFGTDHNLLALSGPHAFRCVRAPIGVIWAIVALGRGRAA